MSFRLPSLSAICFVFIFCHVAQYTSIRLKECKNVDENTSNSVVALSLRLLTLLFLKSSKAVLIVSIAICSLGASLFVTLDLSDEVQHIPSATRVTSVNSRRWNSLCCSNSAVQIVVCSQLFLFFFIYVQFVVSYTVLEQRFSSSCFAFQSLVPS